LLRRSRIPPSPPILSQAELSGLGVSIDDLRRTWTSDDAAGYLRVGPPSDTIEDEVVAKKLEARAAAKRMRDYATADKIQAEVRSMGVELNNRDLTWRYT
jgi:cysteinyl-tRNA synthetase